MDDGELPPRKNPNHTCKPGTAWKVAGRDSNPYAESPLNSAAATRLMAQFNVREFTL